MPIGKVRQKNLHLQRILDDLLADEVSNTFFSQSSISSRLREGRREGGSDMSDEPFALAWKWRKTCLPTRTFQTEMILTAGSARSPSLSLFPPIHHHPRLPSSKKKKNVSHPSNTLCPSDPPITRQASFRIHQSSVQDVRE